MLYSSRGRKMSFYFMSFGLVLLRIAIRWNQTGNKFIGEPDIAKTYLLKNSTMLWLLVTISYLWNLSSLLYEIRHLKSPTFEIMIIAMSTAALSLKVSLTNEDSPEIIGNWLRFIVNFNFGIPIVIRVRLLFLILSVILFFAITLRLRHKTTSYRKAPNLNYNCYCYS